MASFQTLRQLQQENGWTDAQVAELACRYVDKLGSSPSAFHSFISQSTPVEVSTGVVTSSKSRNQLVAELSIQIMAKSLVPRETVFDWLWRVLVGGRVKVYEMMDPSVACAGAEQAVDRILEARQ